MASINTSPGRDKFGADPAAYDLARPGYPLELFDWLRETCALGEASDCFEIGAGTGHATAPVLALPVRSVLAIEPDRPLALSATSFFSRADQKRANMSPYSVPMVPGNLPS